MRAVVLSSSINSTEKYEIGTKDVPAYLTVASGPLSFFMDSPTVQEEARQKTLKSLGMVKKGTVDQFVNTD